MEKKEISQTRYLMQRIWANTFGSREVVYQNAKGVMTFTCGLFFGAMLTILAISSVSETFHAQVETVLKKPSFSLIEWGVLLFVCIQSYLVKMLKPKETKSEVSDKIKIIWKKTDYITVAIIIALAIYGLSFY